MSEPERVGSCDSEEVHLVPLHPRSREGEVIACMRCGQPFEVHRDGEEISLEALPAYKGLALESVLLPCFVWTYSRN